MGQNDQQDKSLVAGDGNDKGSSAENHQSSSDWLNDLDADLKPRLEKFRTPKDLAKSYVELEKYSSKAVQDMTPAEKDKFFKRLGLPESSEDYELSSVVMPKELPSSKEADAAFKELALKLKLTKAQAKELHEYASKNGANAFIAAKQANAKKKEEAETSLRGEWGTDFDGNLRGAQEVVRKFGDDDIVQYMNEGPGNEPRMLKFLLKIKKAISDDTLEQGRVPLFDRKAANQGFVFDPSKSPELANGRR